VFFLGRGEIQDAFNIFQTNTKEEIAEMLVGIFPELLTRLPPKRKKWQPERRVMVVFGAVAVGFAYWQRNGIQSPPPE
jgi:ABC-type branched-subunit amino acid transport system permease subunit